MDDTSGHMGITRTLARIKERYMLTNVIVLEKRDHFAVKLFFQYKQVKVDTQLGFVHNSECLN